jgi:hypothetical protein
MAMLSVVAGVVHTVLYSTVQYSTVVLGALSFELDGKLPMALAVLSLSRANYCKQVVSFCAKFVCSLHSGLLFT